MTCRGDTVDTAAESGGCGFSSTSMGTLRAHPIDVFRNWSSSGIRRPPFRPAGRSYIPPLKEDRLFLKRHKEYYARMRRALETTSGASRYDSKSFAPKDFTFAFRKALPEDTMPHQALDSVRPHALKRSKIGGVVRHVRVLWQTETPKRKIPPKHQTVSRVIPEAPIKRRYVRAKRRKDDARSVGDKPAACTSFAGAAAMAAFVACVVEACAFLLGNYVPALA
ncbi:hypothetical protein HPB50_023451 [Hyalomma asiaticum]|uniref:Uncharacterized protein n=1 Tax=Hyalomma asiaticum TaxID=266040 RepID=A0ACB7TN47_HYAAI|nr:hypothetical protein HPB50_023451 [Hyalomma asiaticum]